MYHVRQVAPSVSSGIPRDRAITDCEIDVASCQDPPAVVNTGGGSRAARWQIGNWSPGVGIWIVAISVARKGVAARCVNIAAESHCHQAMVRNRIVCSHRPGICSDIINLDVKIGADRAARDAIDFSVQICGGVEVGRNGIRGQARVVRIGRRVVAPKRGRGVEVLIHTAEQVDVGAVTCAAEPSTRCWKGSYRCPGITCRVVLVSVCDSCVVYDPAKTIDAATC